MRRWQWLRLALLVGAFALRPHAAGACAAVFPGRDAVKIAGEEAVIVWDARTHTEHFVRRADFRTDAKNFGFLVPTPTPPRLAEVPDRAFSLLEQTGWPPVVRHVTRGLRLTSLFQRDAAATRFTMGTNTTGAAVDVLSAQRVAGYDAVVLKADDAPALTGWLRRHGYRIGPAFADWLRPYVRRHWVVTAFKIARPETPFPIPFYGSSAVRMSFTTPRPFFPYSEPADQRGPGRYAADRLLRVFVLSDARMDGALDAAAVRWPGRVRWAQSPLPAEESSLEAALGLSHAQMPAPFWLTAFEDTSSPRPGVADLYFRPAAQQTPLSLPPVEQIVDERLGVPVELILAAGLGLAWSLVAIGRRETRR